MHFGDRVFWQPRSCPLVQVRAGGPETVRNDMKGPNSPFGPMNAMETSGAQPPHVEFDRLASEGGHRPEAGPNHPVRCACAGARG